MRGALFIAVVVLAGCFVDLPDEPGRACDDLHPCEAGRDCVDGFCRDEGTAGGGDTAGGSATAGGGATAGGQGGGGATAGGSAGGGMIGDAGQPIWLQRVHGFTGQSKLGSASIVIRTDAGNEVTSTVSTSDDANDRATANQVDAGALPVTGNGHLKGKFRLPSALSLKNTSTFMRLENGSNVVVALQFNATGQLIVRSDTGFLGPTGYTQTVSWAGGFTANTDYTIDVSWKRGQYRTLAINGMAILPDITASNPGTGLVLPDQLRLGIYRYDGDAGTGWSVILSDWALADDPSVPL